MKALAMGRLAAVICASLAVAGCVAGGGADAPQADAADAGAGAGAGGAAEATSAVTLVERDVESPEVFQVSDQGLWDGRPSLGGVWVAHATVKEPERVMIRNPANGKYVVGALFRREFENPGPTIQVSSDAAESLGMLAGQPVQLNVVALRREELPDGGIPADPDAGIPAPVTADKAGEDAPAPVATADVAVAAEADQGGEGQTAAATVAADAAVALAETPAAAPAVAEPPKKKRWSLFGKRKAKAEPAAEATVASAAPGTIEATPLDPQPGTAAPAAASGTGAAAAPLPSAVQPASALKRSYVQIGIFSSAANAKKAGAQMGDAGMAATIKDDQAGGKPFWRVIIGPAATEAERDALVGRVKALGYPDAYPVAK